MDVKEMYKARCTHRVVVLLLKPELFFDTVVVVVAVAQLLIYIPKLNKTHSPAWHVVQYK